MEVGKNVVDPVRIDIGESTNVVASLLTGNTLSVGLIVTPPPLPPFRAYDAVKAYDAVSWLTIEGVTVILPEWMSIDPDTVKLPATVAKSVCTDVPIKVIAPKVVYVSTTDVVNVTRSVAVEATINVSVVAPCISVTEVPSASEEKSTPPLLIVVPPF